MEVQFGDPGEGSHANQSKYPNDLSSYGSCADSDEDMQTDKINSSNKRSEDGMDSFDAAYGSYESTSALLCLPAPENVTSTPVDSVKLQNTIGNDAEQQKHGLLDATPQEMANVKTFNSEDLCTNKHLQLGGLMGPIASETRQEDEIDPGLVVATSEGMTSVEKMNSEDLCSSKPLHLGALIGPTGSETRQGDKTDFGLLLATSEAMIETLTSEDPCTNKPHEFGVNSVGSGNVEASTFDQTPVEPEIDTCHEVSKTEILSEDEDISFPKSGAESSSSKDGSPSGPSCSGTSHRDMYSYSSDSDTDLPDINISLPLKKRKRDSAVETLSSSSCSEDENTPEIDYANLTPDQIKALIEQAKSIKHKCRCPKKKLADLPVVGPTKPSSQCNVGKGDWWERKPCEECAGGFCNAPHKHNRGNRRRHYTRSALAKSRARGTIGQDVPIIDISDEEGSPVPNRVASEVTIATAPAGECIVLSSSDDDDDIVCEGVIHAEPKPQEPKDLSGGSYVMGGSPEVVVLNFPSVDTGTQVPPGGPEGPADPAAPLPAAAAAASAVAPVAAAAPAAPSTAFAAPGSAASALVPPFLPLPAALGSDLDYLWPGIADEDFWNQALCDSNTFLNTGDMTANSSQTNASTAAPDRPSSPEGWSCPICLEPKTSVTEIMSTTCGHIFCGTCIRSAVKIHKKCPTCRKKLTAKQFHKIFL